MKAAIVEQAGRKPVYGDFKEPVPSAGENLIVVAAAALSPVVKARASGTHYSSSGDFPIGVGIDGVGRLGDGRRVHFFLPRVPYGSMAERVVVPSSQCTSVPDGLDDITAAAIAIPGMSSWVALKERAKFVAGEAVLVNGATGASGRLAVQVAKYLGAKKVIATGRQAAALQSIKDLGADETILLVENRDALYTAGTAILSRRLDDRVPMTACEAVSHHHEAATRASALRGDDPFNVLVVSYRCRVGATMPSDAPALTKLGR